MSRDRFDVLERFVPLFEAPEPSVERFRRRRDRKRRNQRIAAGVVGIAVFVAAIWIVTSGMSLQRSQTPGGGGFEPTGSPEPTVVPTEQPVLPGLPAEGASPSTPEHGRLVLYLEGSVPGGLWTAVWVYADGRVIWGDMWGDGYFPSGAPTEGATGFVEQRLTPAGVEFLQTQVLSTGLFEHDLDLLLDPPSGFLTIEARNGDRLVQVTWAWDGIVGKDVPSATSEQASALEGIHALLAHPASWPASAWEDEDPATYVPSRYQVWLRVPNQEGTGWNPRVGEREVGLLPPAAVAILRGGSELSPASYELATGDVRALAEALNEAGLDPLGLGGAILRYELENPYQPGSPMWVVVGPVLPHGEAIFLGPG